MSRWLRYASDCAVHNAPAFAPGSCDCGASNGQGEAHDPSGCHKERPHPMTTTAERARAILKAHADTMAALRDAPRDELRLEGIKAMFALEGAITAALHQAQNDKLEEAARGLADAAKGLDTRNPEIARLINVAMSEICDRIIKEEGRP